MLKQILSPAFAMVLLLPAGAAIAGLPSLKTLHEQQVGQWADPRTPPESRTRCTSEGKGIWPWGGNWRACRNWRTEARVMEVKATLFIWGPKDLAKPEKRMAQECGKLAAASAAQVGLPETATAQTVATTNFATCAARSGLAAPERFETGIETRTEWGDWH